jgi:FAD:protein FMN transferase
VGRSPKPCAAPLRKTATAKRGVRWNILPARRRNCPGALTETVDLIDSAVATSAGAGFRFDPEGRFTHLFDPATGHSPQLYRTVSVIAPTATEADALSTAFSLMPPSRIQGIVAIRPGVQARVIDSAGTLVVYRA